MSDFMDDISTPVNTAQPQPEQSQEFSSQNFWTAQASGNLQNAAPSESVTASTQPSGYGTRPNDYGTSSSQSGYNTAATQPSGYGTRPNDYGTSSSQSGYNTAASQPSGYGTRPNDYGSPSAVEAANSLVMPQGYTFTDVLKGILGAVLGSIPGFILFVITGRFGYIMALSGALLAAGAFWGYSRATQNVLIPIKVNFAVCISVCVLAVYFGVKTCWCIKMVELESWMPDLYSSLSSLYALTGEEMSKAEFNKEFYGISEITFSNCFFNFGTILDKLSVRGEYVTDLLLSFLFAGGGAFGLGKKKRKF